MIIPQIILGSLKLYQGIFEINYIERQIEMNQNWTINQTWIILREQGEEYWNKTIVQHYKLELLHVFSLNQIDNDISCSFFAGSFFIGGGF